MKKKDQVRKRAYITPVTQVVSAAPVQMVCATVTPDSGNSGSSSSWNSDSEHQGGSFYFGDESSVAPAKQGNAWAEDWED